MQKNNYLRITPILALLLLLCIALNATAQTNNTSTAPKLEEYINAIAKQGFSGTVLISQDGKVIYKKGVGLANREFDIPNTPEIKFRLGSITKQFTAAAILLLQERGKLKVTDPICQYVDNCSEAWSGVTIQHLLTHTSGIPSYTSANDYWSKMMIPETIITMVNRFKDKPLEFKPGEKMVYSNSGYYLLGYIIEKASGQAYESFLKKNIFTPLNLNSSGYDHPTVILKNRASGYEQNQQGEINSNYLDMMQPYAAGSLYSTVDDLFTWNEALFGGKVLSADSLAAMTKPVLNNYSYGLVTNQKFNRTRISHGGGINGFSTFLARYPQEKVTVAVLRNTSQGKFNPGAVADTLAAILFSEP